MGLPYETSMEPPLYWRPEALAGLSWDCLGTEMRAHEVHNGKGMMCHEVSIVLDEMLKGVMKVP